MPARVLVLLTWRECHTKGLADHDRDFTGRGVNRLDSSRGASVSSTPATFRTKIAGIKRLIPMEQDGSSAKPEFGSIWYHIAGADRDHVSQEVTIAAPGATQASRGLSDQRRHNGARIMNAGTSTADVMIPGR